MKDMPDEYWRKKLTAEQYRVLREKGTERAFSGKLLNNHAAGIYQCAACGSKLFSSEAKFDSGTGWPSFDNSVNLEHVELKEDTGGGMIRTEVICKNCGGHLGHLFDDSPRGEAGGPTTTGKRYCINSCALNFEAK